MNIHRIIPLLILFLLLMAGNFIPIAADEEILIARKVGEAGITTGQKENGSNKLSKVDASIDKKSGIDAFKGCSLACAVNWDVKCSSHLPSSGGNTYTVDMLNDGNFSTAWVEGAKDNGIGEWVEFKIKNHPGKKAEATTFWGLNISNGYRKSKEIWKKNSRVKQLQMDINGKPRLLINLKDTMFNQNVSFKSFDIKPGDVIRFTIIGVYPGSKYKDTCITELIPMGAH